MNDETSHLKRTAVLSAVKDGLHKATKLLGSSTDIKEDSLLVRFIDLLAIQQIELRKNPKKVDISLETFIENKTLMKNLKEKGHISTIQELMLSSYSDFQSVFRYVRQPTKVLREVLYVMRPNIINVKPDRKKK